MDRKERIHKYMSSSAYIPLKFSELMTVLDVPREDEEKLRFILNELEKEGKIFVTKRGRYIPSPGDMLSGTLRVNAKKGFAFVSPDDSEKKDIFIPSEKMLDALSGDRVLVRIEKKAHGDDYAEGCVVKTLERITTQLCGVVEKVVKGYYRICPDDKRILSHPKVKPSFMMNARSGDRVILDITRVDEKGDIYGRVSLNLGKSKNINSIVNSVIYTAGFNPEFPKEVLDEARALGNEIKKDDLSGRLDLRDETIFTIDGDDAKDFDDAVSIKKLPNGWRLGVHIADVSHYVTEKSQLDKEAQSRGTSLYIPGKVIPMLPEELSNGLCSLKPGVDRLTLSVIMEIDKNGGVFSHTLTESVINSKYRLTYGEVSRLLNGDTDMLTKYEAISDELREMQTLAGVLENRRNTRGAVSFDFPESKITVDEKGYPTNISIEERGISNKIIEEFMLTANETIAEYAYWSQLPFIYRIHEPPSFEKLSAFKKYIEEMGYQLKESFDKATSIHPKTLQALTQSISGEPEERAISKNLLQSLMKAEYSPENSGHFGLAAKYYCHFTSPIRRYPDLAIHRILKSAINGSAAKKLAAFEGFVKSAAKKSSDRELKAQETERRIEDILKAYYMSGYIGKSYTGTVSGITSFGMFAELGNTVEGLVRLTAMTDDYYVFNEKNMTLSGNHFGNIYKIGDRVRVKLIGCDVLGGQIDFELKGKDTTDE